MAADIVGVQNGQAIRVRWHARLRALGLTCIWSVHGALSPTCRHALSRAAAPRTD